MRFDTAGMRLGTFRVCVDPVSLGGVGGVERNNHGGLSLVDRNDLGDELLERRDGLSVGGDRTRVSGDINSVSVDVHGIGGC